MFILANYSVGQKEKNCRSSFSQQENLISVFSHICVCIRICYFKVKCAFMVYDYALVLVCKWSNLVQHIHSLNLFTYSSYFSCLQLSFIPKDRANSLAWHIRQSLLSFVDAIEKILEDQMCLELHSDGTCKWFQLVIDVKILLELISIYFRGTTSFITQLLSLKMPLKWFVVWAIMAFERLSCLNFVDIFDL